MSMEAFLRQGFVPFEQALLEQPAQLRDVVGRLRPHLAGLSQGVPSRPVFIGIGASLAAVATAVSHLNRSGISALRVNAAEIEHEPNEVGDLVVAVSQSGRSRETVGALRNISGDTLAVVNVTDSPMAELATETLSLGHLSDSLASSIGYTATVVAVSMLCETWTLGRPSANWDSLGDRVAEFAGTVRDEVEQLALLMDDSAVVDVIAPVEHLGSAEAASLLMREVPRVPAAPFESRQYLHGLMEASGVDTLHLLFDGPDSIHVLPRLERMGRRVALFRNSSDRGQDSHIVGDGSAVMFDLPSRSALEVPVFAALVVQQACAAVARRRGIDPDEFLFLDTDIKLGDVA